VQWLVLPDPIEVSKAQIAAFDARISHNSRPLQSIGDRSVSVSPK
jgi:carbonic anhydrase